MNRYVLACASLLGLCATACGDDVGRANSATGLGSSTGSGETGTPTTGVSATSTGSTDTLEETGTPETGDETAATVADETGDDETGDTTAETCGDGAIDGGDVCDGADLGGADCVSEGFEDGTLACLDDCSGFDTSGCGACGNDMVDGDDVCDGSDFGGEDCSTQGFDSGTLVCSDDCGGFDTAGCGTCGNALIDGSEPCDGAELDGETCLSQGFDSGTLTCAADCTAFDTSGCGTCGNDMADGDEACDGADLAGEDCASQGFDGGTLGCSDTCAFDTSSCESSTAYLFTVRESDDVLRVFDTETLTFTDIGPLGVTFQFGEIAWDSSTDTMWMIDGRGAESLYTVNINTGAATLVGLHGIDDLFGLAHVPATGTLFGSGESPVGLYTMNQMTGAATFIGDPIAADGLTYDSIRDELVGLAASGDLHTIDPMTGASTVVINEGFVNNCGLAHETFNDLYWAITWSGNLFTYDPNNAYARTQVLTGLGAHDGLTWVPGYTP